MSTAHRVDASPASLTTARSGSANETRPQERFHPPSNPLAVALRNYQNALDEWDESIADILGVNRTDLRCIDLLSMSQPMTAGELARAAGLSSGAMTFVLDRLERAGMLARKRDEEDRRKVLVELLPEAAQRALALHMPLIRAMRARLSALSADDLAAITRFFAMGTELYRTQAGRLRATVPSPSGPPETLTIDSARAFPPGCSQDEAVLELRPNCERCDIDLPPESNSARICSFECTFCQSCAESVYDNRCPNCGGELVARPTRPAAALLQHPASTNRVLRDSD